MPWLFIQDGFFSGAQCSPSSLHPPALQYLGTKGLPSLRCNLLRDCCRLCPFCEDHRRFFFHAHDSDSVFLAQRPDPSGDRYFALLSRTHLWRPTTCEWLYVAGLWESKECNHFSRFSSAWRSIIIHSTTLLQARLENMDFRSFIVQGWNFRSKGAFWFCLHCGAVRAPPTTKVKDSHVYGSTFIYQKKPSSVVSMDYGPRLLR